MKFTTQTWKSDCGKYVIDRVFDYVRHAGGVGSKKVNAFSVVFNDRDEIDCCHTLTEARESAFQHSIRENR